jgi:hypothetical protein
MSGVQTRSNVPQTEPLRWNLKKAAIEFRISKDTLRKNLNQVSATPGEDGCYSTEQITGAVFGDLYNARLRVENERYERLRLENEFRRGEQLDKHELTRCFDEISDAISSRVMSIHELSREVKQDILRELSRSATIILEVSDRQTKHRTNGPSEEEDES